MNPDKPQEPVMYVHTMAVFLNPWFTRYEDTRAARAAGEGYLFDTVAFRRLRAKRELGR